MKKQLSLFVWAVATFGMTSVWAAPYTRSANYEAYESYRSSNSYSVKKTTTAPRTNTYKRSDMYRSYNNNPTAYRYEPVVQRRVVGEPTYVKTGETVNKTANRKYYLAHPFFQPLKGKIGSITDLAYASSSYDIKVTPLPSFTISDDKATWETSQFTIKEDLSYGITDRFALMGMLRYSSTTHSLDWSTDADDEMKDSGIDLWGLGAQWRFADNAEWIATLSGYYQKNIDIADTFIVDLKGGYKVGNSTLYGLARAWYVSFEGDSYGNGIEGDNAAIFLAYKVGENKATYIEGGLGVFTVLNPDWTLNLELLYGNYDWHNQASAKAAIGWQPGDSFALNLYVKTSIYDSAENKDLSMWAIDPVNGITSWTHFGNANLTNYSETSVGLQGILYF